MNARLASSDEPRGDRLGDDRAEPVDGGQLARPAPPSPRRACRSAAASACAAAGPRCLMPSAVSSRGSGRCREPSIAASSLSALIVAKPSSVEQLLRGQRVEVGGVGDQPGRRELGDGALAEPLDVHRPARREVDDPLVALERARRLDAAGVGLALEAHERAAAAGTGTSSGTSTARRPSGASTAPARRPRGSRRRPCARSRCRRAGRPWPRTWSSLCSVATPTVEPPTNTGSSTANGVARPVRPIDTWMSRSTVVRSSGGNL